MVNSLSPSEDINSSDLIQHPKDIPSGYSHSFDVGIARKISVNAAIVYNHILYWLRINKSKGFNFHEEKTWMYETCEEISVFFGYLSAKQVRDAINLLVDHGLLVKGNFSRNKFDRTTWYTLDFEERLGELPFDFKVKSILPVGKMEETPGSNAIDDQGNCVIYNNKNTKKNTNIEPIGSKEKKSDSSSKKEERIPHGSHVKLTSTEYNKLFCELGESRLKDLIERVNDYCAANKPKGYSCYAAAIRNFAKNQKNQTQGFKNENVKDNIRKRQLDEYTKANGSFEDGVLRFD